jgi:hypothetical protein
MFRLRHLVGHVWELQTLINVESLSGYKEGAFWTELKRNNFVVFITF